MSRVLGSDRVFLALLIGGWLLAAAYAVSRERRDRTPDADEPGEAGRATEGTGEYVGEERSDEEIASLGEADAQAEPAEPGELTVDDEVVDEVLEADERDEEDEEDEGDEGEGEGKTDARTDGEETPEDG